MVDEQRRVDKEETVHYHTMYQRNGIEKPCEIHPHFGSHVQSKRNGVAQSIIKEPPVYRGQFANCSLESSWRSETVMDSVKHLLEY